MHSLSIYYVLVRLLVNRGTRREERQLLASCSSAFQKPQASGRLLAASAQQFALTEWRAPGVCTCLWVGVASALVLHGSSALFPPPSLHGAPGGITGRLVSLGYKAHRRGCLSSAAPDFGLSDGGVSHPLLPGNFRSPKEGFTVWRRLRIIITLNLVISVSQPWTGGFQT